MIIVKIYAGFGNQMFQYALYRKLCEMGKEVKVDLSYFQIRTDVDNGLYLFPIKFEEATEKDVKRISDTNRFILSRLRRKIFGRRKTYYLEDTEVHYEDEIFNVKNAYLEGYWQSEKYFLDIREILINEFQFPQSNNIKNIEVMKHIENSVSVSVHIRRGDYLSQGPSIRYGGICTLKYYERAINYIKNLYNNVSFFVFSDDIEWARNNFSEDRMTFIDWNQGHESYYDMYLMSCCKHNIIANSSFSWWGAWLNRNPDKIVISPDKWFNIHEAPDIICDGWIKISGER